MKTVQISSQKVHKIELGKMNESEAHRDRAKVEQQNLKQVY